MDSELFVQNVRKLCHARGELPTIVCKKAGVGSSFISDINRGRTPSVEKVQKLANYLGVTTSTLLGEEKTPTLTKKDERDDGNVNLIKIAGRDGSYTEKRVSDEQLALFQSMLSQMKPVDDDV